jgi:NIMA-interacting peptidyl-prolyl cis-trans isomerase 1
MSDQQVRARHLLVKHSGSRNPKSWRFPQGITISKEEAREKLIAYQKRLVSGEVTFAALATTESDCSSAQKGGDLGFFTRGMMQKPFEDATFGLAVGQMSGIVDTDSGLHLILREA